MIQCKGIWVCVKVKDKTFGDFYVFEEERVFMLNGSLHLISFDGIFKVADLKGFVGLIFGPKRLGSDEAKKYFEAQEKIRANWVD